MTGKARDRLIGGAARLLSSTALAGMVAMAPAAAQVLPTGGTTAATSTGGQSAQIGGTATDMTVGLRADRTVIDWTTFSVGAINSVTFNGAAGSGVLNRVTTAVPSQIDGSISAPGVSVWLVNGSGVTFGAGGSFSGGSLILSTANLANGDFIDGNAAYSLTGATTSALTLTAGTGTILAPGGFIAVGQRINAGKTISTTATGTDGEVALIAARDVNLTFTPGSPISATITSGTTLGSALVSSGQINAGTIRLYGLGAGAVTDTLLNVNSGAALNVTETNGRIILATSGSPGNGLIDGTSGNVARGVAIANGATIDASATGASVLVQSAGSAVVGAGVTTGGAYTVSGTQVTLGAAGQTVSQTAGGAVSITATGSGDGAAGAVGGTVTGLGTLTVQAGGTGSLAISGNGVTDDNGAAVAGSIQFGNATLGAPGAITLTGASVNAVGGLDILSLGGTASVAGSVTTGGAYSVQGTQVTLGAAGQTVSQTAGGAVSITATGSGNGTAAAVGGRVTGLGTLTLQAGGTGALAISGNGVITDTGATRNGSVQFGDATLRAQGAISLTANGTAADGVLDVRSTGDTVTIAGNVTTGGDYLVRGTQVTLGTTGQVFTQGTGGAVTITATGSGTTGGVVTAFGTLTLKSANGTDIIVSGNDFGGGAGSIQKGTTDSILNLTAGSGTGATRGAVNLTGSGGIAAGTVFGSSLVTGATTQLTSDGVISLGGVTVTDALDIRSTANAVTVAGAVTTGGAYTVSGTQVTLGTAAQTLTQSAGGPIAIVAAGSGDTTAAATGGVVTGLGTLTLQSGGGGALSVMGASVVDDTNADRLGSVDLGTTTLLAGGKGPALANVLLTGAGGIKVGSVTGNRLSTDGTQLKSQGAITLGTVDVTDPLDILSTGGMVTITGDVTAGSSFAVSGTQVTLGTDGRTVTQGTGGAVTITATGSGTTGGVVTALGTLTLKSADGTDIAVSGNDFGGGAGSIQKGTTDSVLNLTAGSGTGATRGAVKLTGSGGIAAGTVFGRSLVTGATTQLTSGGAISLGDVTVTDALDIRSTANSVAVAGAVTTGGAYTVSGTQVTLGAATQALTQGTGGAVTITATGSGTTGGVVTALGTLTLKSADGTDIAVSGTDFGGGAGSIQKGTTDSVLNLTAGSGTGATRGAVKLTGSGGIAAGTVFGRSLVTGAATQLTSDGAISLGGVTVTDALDIRSTANMVTVAGAVTTGGAYSVQGRQVSLGTTGQALTQGTGGAVTITATGSGTTGGVVTALGTLTLKSADGTDIAVSGTDFGGGAGSIQKGTANAILNLTAGSGTGTSRGAVNLTGSGGIAAGTVFGSSLVTGAGTQLTASGAIDLVSVDVSAPLDILSNNGAVTITGDVTTGAGYSVQGRQVTLGTANTAITQKSGGAVRITAIGVAGVAGGTVTGLGDLTLQSGAGSVLSVIGNDVSGGFAGEVAFEPTSFLTAGTSASRGAVVLQGNRRITAGTIFGSSLTTAPGSQLTSNGAISLTSVDVTDPLDILSAGNAVTITGRVRTDGSYSVQGTQVTLGNITQAVSQTAAGAVTIVATGSGTSASDVVGGAVTALGALTLQSDRNGGGAGDLTIDGRDMTIGGVTGRGTVQFGAQSRIVAGTIASQPDTYGLQSGAVLRGNGGITALGTIAARTLASPASAELFSNGTITLGDLIAAEAVSITTNGIAADIRIDSATIGDGTTPTSSLTLLTQVGGDIVANSSAGKRLIAGGDIMMTSTAGSIQLREARSLAGSIRIEAAGDVSGVNPSAVPLNLGGISAGTVASVGDASLTADTGDIRIGGLDSNGVVSGFTGVRSSGGSVSAVATSGSVTGLDTTPGADGAILNAQNTILVTSHSASVALASATAQTGLVDISGQGLSLAGVSAGTTATLLGTGGTPRAVALTSSTAALDGALGFGSLAAGGSVTVSASRIAQLGVVDAGTSATVGATAATMVEARARTGALDLTARGGGLYLGRGQSGTIATLTKQGVIASAEQLDELRITGVGAPTGASVVATAGLRAGTNATITSTTDARIRLAASTAGNVAVTLTSGRDVTGILAASPPSGASRALVRATDNSPLDSRYDRATLTADAANGLVTVSAPNGIAQLGDVRAGTGATTPVGGLEQIVIAARAIDLSRGAAFNGTLRLTASEGGLYLAQGYARGRAILVKQDLVLDGAGDELRVTGQLIANGIDGAVVGSDPGTAILIRSARDARLADVRSGEGSGAATGSTFFADATRQAIAATQGSITVEALSGKVTGLTAATATRVVPVEASASAGFAGDDLIVGTLNAGSASLTADASDIRIGMATSSGDLSVTAALGSVTGTAGPIAPVAPVIADNAAVRPVGGAILSAARDIRVRARDTAELADLRAGGVIDIAASRIVIGRALTDATSLLDAQGGTISLSAGIDALLGNLSAGTGGMTLQAAGLLDLVSGTAAGGIIGITAGDAVIGAVTATVGGDPLTSGSITLTATAGPAAGSVPATTGRINLTNGNAGSTLTLRAANAVIGTASAGVLADVGVTGALSLATGSGGSVTATAATAVIGTLTPSQTITVTTSGPLTLANATTTTGDITISASNAAIGSADAGGSLGITTGAGLALGTGKAGAAVTLRNLGGAADAVAATAFDRLVRPVDELLLDPRFGRANLIASGVGSAIAVSAGQGPGTVGKGIVQLGEVRAGTGVTVPGGREQIVIAARAIDLSRGAAFNGTMRLTASEGGLYLAQGYARDRAVLDKRSSAADGIGDELRVTGQLIANGVDGAVVGTDPGTAVLIRTATDALLADVRSAEGSGAASGSGFFADTTGQAIAATRGSIAVEALSGKVAGFTAATATRVVPVAALATAGFGGDDLIVGMLTGGSASLNADGSDIRLGAVTTTGSMAVTAALGSVTGLAATGVPTGVGTLGTPAVAGQPVGGAILSAARDIRVRARDTAELADLRAGGLIDVAASRIVIGRALNDAALLLDAQGGAISLTAGSDALLGRLSAGTGMTVTAGRLVDLVAGSAGDISLTAGDAVIGGLNATGSIAATVRGATASATGGVLNLTSGSAGSSFTIRADNGVIGTGAAGGLLDIGITGALSLGSGGGGSILISAGTAVVVGLMASQDIGMTVAGGLTLGSAKATSGSITIAAGNAGIASLDAGTSLSVTTGAGLALVTGKAVTSATLHNLGGAADAVGATASDRLVRPQGEALLDARYGRANLIASGAGGTIAVSAGQGPGTVGKGIAQLGEVRAGSGVAVSSIDQIAVTARAVDITRAAAFNGTLRLTASEGGLYLAQGYARGRALLEKRDSTDDGAGDELRVTGQLIANGLDGAVAGTDPGTAMLIRSATDARLVGVRSAEGSGAATGEGFFADAGPQAIATTRGSITLDVRRDVTGLAAATVTQVAPVAASGLAGFAGDDLIAGTLTAGGAIGLTADASDVRLGTVTGGGDMTVTAAVGSVTGLSTVTGAAGVPAGLGMLDTPVVAVAPVGGAILSAARNIGLTAGGSAEFAELSAGGVIDVGAGRIAIVQAISDGAIRFTASGDAMLGRLAAGADGMDVRAGGLLDLVEGTGGTVAITASDAVVGALTASGPATLTIGNRLNLTSGSAASAFAVRAGEAVIDTVSAGGLLDIGTTGALSLASGSGGSVMAAPPLSVRVVAGNAVIGTLTGAQNGAIVTGGGLTLGSATSTGGGISVAAGNAAIASLDAGGALDITTGAGLALMTGKAGAGVTVHNIGGAADAVGATAFDRLMRPQGEALLDGRYGRADLAAKGTLTFSAGQATGAAKGIAQLGTVQSGGAFDGTARAIDVVMLASTGGSIGLTASEGGLYLDTGKAATGATLLKRTSIDDGPDDVLRIVTSLTSGQDAAVTSESDIRFARVEATDGSVTMTAARDVTGLLFAATGFAPANTLSVGSLTSGGNATLTADRGDIRIGDGSDSAKGVVATGGDVTVTATLGSVTGLGADAPGGAGGIIAAGSGVAVKADGNVALTSVAANSGSVAFGGQADGAATLSVAVGGIAAGTSVGIVASDGLSLGTVAAGGAAMLRTTGGSADAVGTSASDRLVRAVDEAALDTRYGRADLTASGAVIVSAGQGPGTVAKGIAQLGDVQSGGLLGVTARAIDISRAASTGGALSVTASEGGLYLDTATAATTATLEKKNSASDGAGDELRIATGLTSGQAMSVTSATDLRFAAVQSTAGSVTMTATGDITGIVPPTAIFAPANALSVATVTSGTGAKLTADQGDIRIGGGSASAKGIVATGGDVSVTATLGSVTGLAGAPGGAGGTIAAATDIAVTASGNVALTRVAAGSGSAGLSAFTVAVGSTTAGAGVDVTAVSGLSLGTVGAGGTATLRTTGGTADAVGTTVSDRLVRPIGDRLLDARYGRVDLVAAGAVAVSAGQGPGTVGKGIAQLGAVQSGGLLDVKARAVDIVTAGSTGGAMSLTASEGGLYLDSGTAATLATLDKRDSVNDGAGDELRIVTGLTSGQAMSITSATDLRFAKVTSTAGSVTMAAKGDITGIVPPVAVFAPANALSVGSLTSGAASSISADQGDIRIGDGSAATKGVTATGGTVTVTATLGSVTGLAEAPGGIGGTITAGTDVTIRADGNVALTNVAAGSGSAGATAFTVAVGGISAGTGVDVTAVSGMSLGTVGAGGTATLRTTAGTADAAGASAFDRLARPQNDEPLDTRYGRANIAASGAIAISAGQGPGAVGKGIAQLGDVQGGGLLSVTARAIDIGRAASTGGAIGFTASEGGLYLGTGTAATTATLEKRDGASDGAGDELRIVTGLTAAQAATITSATDLRFASVRSTAGAVALTAKGDITGIVPPAAVFAPANALSVGSLTSGGAVKLTADRGDIRIGDGSAATTGVTAANGDVTAVATLGSVTGLAGAPGGTGGTVAAGTTVAVKADGNVALTSVAAGGGSAAFGGIADRSAATTVAVGAITAATSVDVLATSGVSLGSVGAGTTATLQTTAGTAGATDGLGSAAIQATRGSIQIDAARLAQVAKVTAGTGSDTNNVKITSDRIAINDAMTANSITLINKNDGAASRTNLTVIGGTEEGTSDFTLTQAEFDRLKSATLVIDAGAAALEPNVGSQTLEQRSLTLGSGTATSTLKLLGTGIIRLTGPLKAGASSVATLQIGGRDEPGSTAAPVLAKLVVGEVSPTQDAGADITMPATSLDLRGENIVFGDAAFNKLVVTVDAAPPAGTNPGVTAIQANTVANQISDALSGLNNSSVNDGARGSGLFGLGKTYLRASTLTVRYGSQTAGGFALFRNTAPNISIQTGVELDAANRQREVLTLFSTNADPANSFAMFGTIKGRSGTAATLLGAINVGDSGALRVTPSNTRFNGCFITSGSKGCLNTDTIGIVPQMLDDRQVVLLTAKLDSPVQFDPLLGTNNETLFVDFGGVAMPAAADCAGAACEGDE